MDVFSLIDFKKNFPNRVINIGVAEQNLINMSAGLVKGFYTNNIWYPSFYYIDALNKLNLI